MEQQRDRERYVESLFTLLLAAVFAAGILDARAWPWKTAFFPMVVGIGGFVLAVILSLWIGLRGGGSASDEAVPQGDIFLDDSLRSGEALKRTLVICAWILGIVAATWLVGQPIALPLFVFLYLKVGSGESWMVSLGLTVAVAIFLMGVFDNVIHVSWYDGALLRWFDIELW
jgi:hypothetical protein